MSRRERRSDAGEAPQSRRHGRDRRLPERRQVDAGQPAHADPRRGRARDAGRDARPQGAALRVERRPFRLDRHGRRRRGRPGPFGAQIAEQARAAIEEADLVLFVVDARAGDHARRRGARRDPPRGAASRCSCSPTRSTTRGATSTRSSSTGSGSATRSPLSALHGHGTGDLLDEIVARLPGQRRAVGRRRGDPRRDPRPAERRQVVAPERAARARARDRLRRARARRATRSTRCCDRGDTTFVLVDTAGLRRKRRQRQGIEYYSELRALEAAERADVALVLVDACEGVVEQDLAVADVARKAGCSTLVVLSKWDVDDDRPAGDAGAAPPPAAPAAPGDRGLGEDRPRPRAAARPRRGAVREAHRPDPDRRAQPRARRAARGAARPAGERGRRLRLLYGTQVWTRPPRFRIFVNDPRPRHARLRLLGRERAARRFDARGRARSRSTSAPNSDGAGMRGREGRRRRRRVVGNGVRALLATAATR